MSRAVVSAAAMATAIFQLQARHACVSVVSRTSMALSKLAEMLPTPEIEESPYQPSDFLFSKREFGRKNVVKRSFQPRWFKKHK